MADSPPSVDTAGDTADHTGSAPTTGTPRWVKVFGIIALVVVLLVLVAMLTGLGGDHGPGRHGGGDDTPSTVVEEDGRHRSPVEHRP